MLTDSVILALSTSSGCAQVVASRRNGEVVFSYSIGDYKEQSKSLLPELQNHFLSHTLERDQIVGIAVDIGPGGFTSLRTACGVAQGLAFAWSLPCFPITSFDCLFQSWAAQAQSLNGHGIIILDARLNQFYAQTGMKSHQTWHPAETFLLDSDEYSATTVLSQYDWCLTAPSANQIVTGWSNSFSAYQAALDVAHLVQLAWRRFDEGNHQSAVECQPLYIREKVAETTAERIAKKHNEQN